jgi:hypothetical protein
VDYIYVISDGCIAEQGTYVSLIASGGVFAAFIHEFGAAEEQEEKEEEGSGATANVSKVDSAAGLTKDKEKLDKMKRAAAGATLMQTEERNTGAIEWAVYKTYIKAGYGEVVMPSLVLSLVFMQGATLLSSYWYAVLFFVPFS